MSLGRFCIIHYSLFIFHYSLKIGLKIKKGDAAIMKRLSRIIALTAALLTTLSVVSCSAAAPADNQTETDDSTVSYAEPVEPTETTLETMIGSDNFQQQVKTMSESYEAQGMKLEITAQGNTLIYTCSYIVEGVATDEVKAGLADYLAGDAMTKSMQEVLQYVRETVPETESVKVVYVDVDGQEIISKEYN